MVLAPVLMMAVRMASRGGAAGAGLVLAIPAIAVSVWFLVRRFRSGGRDWG